MSVQVSVVVPTYKRPCLLRNCLDALLRQQFPPEAYEIIIIDDADSDEIRLLVEDFTGEIQQTQSQTHFGRDGAPIPAVRYAAATQTQGPAAARNFGWRMARGEVIAFTDDDCLPEPDWLREGVEALTEDLAGISGRVIVPVPTCPTDYEKNVSRLNECEFVTANCFYRRTALEAAGGFDEAFTIAWREDSDLQFRLLTLCYKLGHAPAARVIHPIRPAPWGISVKEQRKTMFDALLFKKYPEFYRRQIRHVPPLNYYGIVFSSIIFFVAISLGNRWLAIGMSATWLALVFHFASQRLRNTSRTPRHVLEMLLTSIVIPYISIFWRIYGALYYRVWFF